MKYLSVCSGIEAASVAWKGLGWKAAGFSEIEKFPCEVLKYHFPTVPNFGDLTKHENWKIERGAIDVICGGTPCQSFSVAGLRAGMADPRGNLALTFLSLCDRLRPEWIVWENVPGVLSSNGGRDLGAFLGALGQLGYGTAYRILDAQYFGVAQRRRRIFVVANATDWRRAAAVLFEPESLRGDSAPRRAKGQGATAGARRSVETVGTICADSHPGSYAGQDAYTGRLIPHPAPAPVVIDRAAFNQGEGAQYPPRIEASETMSALVARGPHAVGHEMTHTLTRAEGVTEDGSGRGVPIVAGPAPLAVGVDLFNNNTTGNIHVPLRTAGGHGAPAVLVSPPEPQTVTIAFKPGQSAAARSIGANTEIACTLEAGGGGNNKQAVAIVTPAPEPIAFQSSQSGIRLVETHATLDANNGSRRHNGIIETQPIAFHPTQDPISSVGVTHTMGTGTTGGAATIAVAQAYAVRRLTPTECERLQGFPDGWTAIPFRGKPASDGPRYKAIGNSMAVPVMKWIGERIAIVDKATKGEG